MPSIRGLRVPVATVVGMVADGMGEGEILVAYPDLEREDVRQALRRRSSQGAVSPARLRRCSRLRSLVDNALEQGSIAVIEENRLRIRDLPMVGDVDR